MREITTNTFIEKYREREAKRERESRTHCRVQRAESGEHRARIREQRAESRAEGKAKKRWPRPENREQRAESRSVMLPCGTLMRELVTNEKET